MSLTWPWALVALSAFPLLLGYRWWTRRRRRREAVRFSSIALIRSALPGRSLWRRRIPLWLFGVGLVVLGTGAARPQASVPVPSNATSILLTIDVSGSMCSTDVEPNRLSAAQDAAREFIRRQAGGARVGLVAFSGSAGLLVEPTTDTDVLLAAIDTLRTGRGTAMGLGILAAVDAIAGYNPRVPPTGVELPPLPEGSEESREYQSDVIVVLTDGRTTHGVEPVVAAEQAAARGVRVYTIGFGTTEPAALVCTRDQISGDVWFRGDQSPPRGAGRGWFLQLDEPTLTEVAALTGGEYYKAENAESLTDVLLNLPKSIVVQKEKVEITAWFALAGAVLILVAVALAQWWNRTRPMPPDRSSAR